MLLLLLPFATEAAKRRVMLLATVRQREAVVRLMCYGVHAASGAGGGAAIDPQVPPKVIGESVVAAALRQSKRMQQ